VTSELSHLQLKTLAFCSQWQGTGSLFLLSISWDPCFCEVSFSTWNDFKQLQSLRGLDSSYILTAPSRWRRQRNYIWLHILALFIIFIKFVSSMKIKTWFYLHVVSGVSMRICIYYSLMWELQALEHWL
jgi:hypothetical protein